jgi:transmembrane sensor
MTEREHSVSSAFRDLADEQSLHRAWDRIERRLAPRPRRSRTGALVLAAALVAIAGAVLGWWIDSQGPSPLARENGDALGAIAGGALTALDDGSSIRTSADARLRVVENRDGVFSVHLADGSARFEVRPGTGRRWRVEARGVSVEVVGTVFSVERSNESVRVRVERGTVAVRGTGVPDGVELVSAGEELVVLAPPVAEPVPMPMTSEPVLAPEPTVVERSPEPASSAPERARPRPARSPSELLDAADEARRAGRSGEAIALFEQVVREHASSREAPLAAFTAASLLARAGDRSRAREHYLFALERGLPPDLAEAARSALEP